jgi:hypothetical protein
MQSPSGSLTDKSYLRLRQLAWLLFFGMLLLNCVDLAFRIGDRSTARELPFEFESGQITDIRDSTLTKALEHKVLLRIDTLDVTPVIPPQTTPESGDSSKHVSVTATSSKGITVRIFDREEEIHHDAAQIQEMVQQLIATRNELEITVKDTLSTEISRLTVPVLSRRDYHKLYDLIPVLLLIFFTYFNSYLLLRFSEVRANILVVFFLIFLVAPNLNHLPLPLVGKIWRILIAPFWGVLFYDFILRRTEQGKNIKPLYLRTLILYLAVFALSFLHFGELFSILLYIWPTYWLLKAFLLLRKEYNRSKSIELKRLLNAFRGIFIALGAALAIAAVALLMTILIPGSSLLFKADVVTNVLATVLGIIIALLALGLMLGILWFFGSFTWSLLTGTALDVKIRSTLIYTIIGVLFITIFGLIDYALGELLQYLFGQFMGSQFVAGIPGTIVLLALFMPIRNRVERIVDNRLNTSELDFLEKTDSFTQNLGAEGVVEGFEEYLCQNLIQRLPIRKAALISKTGEAEHYIFNEIRGSDIVENSVVQDSRGLLSSHIVQVEPDHIAANPQEISSFALILPIIHEPRQQWHLALGVKEDRAIYNKNDIQSLQKLTEKIKLSLKFILAYENIETEKFERTLEAKDRQIQDYQQQLNTLQQELETLKRKFPSGAESPDQVQ